MNNQQLAFDNFTSGSLAAGWSFEVGLGTAVCQITASAPFYAEPAAITNTYGQVWTGLTWPNDQISEATIQTLNTTGTNSLTLAVRFVAGAIGGYQCVIAHSSTLATLTVYKLSGGSAVQIGSIVTGLTISSGDVWTLAAIGSVILVYQNEKRIFYIGDASFPSGGAPGFMLTATSAVTNAQVSSWRGYSAIQQDGVWQKQGCVMPVNATELGETISGVAGLSAITFGPAKFLSGNVYSAYFGYGNNTGYAESPNGINWTRYPSNPVIVSSDSIIFQNGGTWYGLCQVTQGSSIPHLFTSTDGLSFTDQGATNLPSTGYPCGIIDIIGGNFYAFFGILNGTNSAPNAYIYTAPIGTPLVWTVQNSGNPVIVNAFPGSVVRKIPVNGMPTYFLWATANQPGQGNATASGFDPCEAVRYKSTDLLNWTKDSKSIHNSLISDSLNNSNAGSAVNCVIDVGGKAAMYYQGSPGDSTGPQDYQPMLAIAPYSLSHLVTQSETGTLQVASDSFTNGPGPLSSNWTTQGGCIAPQIVSGPFVEAGALGGSFDSSALYTGATFGTEQYSEVIIQTLTGASNGLQFILPAVLMQLGSESGYYLRLAIRTGVISTNDGNFAILKKVNGTPTILNPAFPTNITLSIGDAIRFQSNIGSDGSIILTVFQNGFQVLMSQDYSATFTSGFPGFQQYAVSVLADSQISSWAGGNSNVIPSFSAIADDRFIQQLTTQLNHLDQI